MNAYRGLIAISQERLAAEYGMTSPKFHRLTHKLADDGFLKLAGGGRQPRTIWLLPNPTFARRAEMATISIEAVPDERTAAALRLFDALCAAVGKTKRAVHKTVETVRKAVKKATR